MTTNLGRNFMRSHAKYQLLKLPLQIDPLDNILAKILNKYSIDRQVCEIERNAFH